MTDHILTEIDGRVLKMTFNRPDKMNAITHAMYDALADGMAEAHKNDNVRCIYITGVEGIFTSGNDLADFRDTPRGGGGGELPVYRFLKALVAAEKPIVVAVNGAAVGIGLTMLLHSDIVVAGESALISAPFVDLALVPEAASSLLLPKRVGSAMAADIFMTGRRLTAAESLDCGLVSRVFADAELQEKAYGIAIALSNKAPNSVRLTKQLMRGDKAAMGSRMMEEGGHFDSQLKSPEFMEAVTAFMERRPPNFG